MRTIGSAVAHYKCFLARSHDLRYWMLTHLFRREVRRIRNSSKSKQYTRVNST